MGLPVIDFLVDVHVHDLQAAGLYQSGDLRGGLHRSRDFLAGIAARIREDQQGVLGLHPMQRTQFSAGVGKREVRGLRSDPVQPAHPGIPFVAFPITVVNEVGSRQLLHERPVEVLVPDGGIRIVKVPGRLPAQFLEHIGFRILALESFHPVEKPGDGAHTLLQGHLVQQGGIQAHLGFERVGPDPVHHRGIAGVDPGGIRETVPEMKDHIAKPFRLFRIHGRDIHLREIPHRNGCRLPPAGPAGAQESHPYQQQVITHFRFLFRWTGWAKLNKKY